MHGFPFVVAATVASDRQKTPLGVCVIWVNGTFWPAIVSVGAAAPGSERKQMV